MITGLGTQNFKSWENLGPIPFAPLTGFFGANNSGKSSLLQILLLLKQTVERTPSKWNEALCFGSGEPLVNLRNFDSIVHQHDAGRTLRMDVAFTAPQTGSRMVTFSTDIVKQHGDVRVEGLTYTSNSQQVGLKWSPQGHRNIVNDQPTTIYRCHGVVDHSSPPTRLKTCQLALEAQFARVHHIASYRSPPHHTYPWGGEHPENVGQHGEHTIPILLSGRINLRSIENDILKRLQELELIDSYDIRSTSASGREYEILVKQYEGGTAVPLTDVGFGVSQVLPVLTECYFADEGSTLILEQPEAHLHPKVQAELADVLIDVVKNRNIQIILESHSEHLLHRLQRRIAEEELLADDTAFYFCKIEYGMSRSERLKVDEYGNILNWPKDFFGDDVGDLIEMAKVEMRRRKEQE